MYKHFGVMLDCSRNSVMQVETLKYFIDCLQKMGYDTLELYTEDTYEVEGDPYFGYQRGRYSGKELREIDAYAKTRGVELIPCIQTLAHFTVLDYGVYRDIIDCEDVLLVDEPKTYEFIERIFQSLAKNFTSRKVNIGMDEAFMIGRGKYLDKHGYVDRTEMLVRHLHKVAEIAKKYGFQTHMWSDMFFRLVSNGEYYESNAPIADSVKKMIPDNVDLCYWDYYHKEKSVYDQMLARHKQFDSGLWFAGGAWTWVGFAPMARFSLHTMKPAMESVREHGIENVFITMWGDNGGECSPFSQLHTLYTIRQYADGNFDQEKIEKGFYELFGVEYADFMLLDLPNMHGFDDPQTEPLCFAKAFLFMDPFMGIFDSTVKDCYRVPYSEYAKKLREGAERAKDFRYIFDELATLCETLAIKTDLGVRTRSAYEKGDKEGLKELVKDYGRVKALVEKFHEAFYVLWHKENKSNGWEIQDARIGGLIRRLDTCARRLNDYIDGKITGIEELEEELLQAGDGKHVSCNRYLSMISRSVM
ncbi:MAG: beta-N-acetylhexosaminidase [Clostridia bacterium]|nr:beta-N-acetylhexosaminidase [Clostridia bacterium]